MNKPALISALSCVVLPCALFAQSPRLEQAAAVVQQLQIQQTELNSNQIKIDMKVSDLAEAIRVARRFAARSGGAHKPPPSK
jgi:hypothetical protein